MLFSPVFIATDPRPFTPACPVYPESRRELRRESRSVRLQTASPTRLAPPRLLQPSSGSRLESSKFHACNLFRCNTYEPSRKCGKQRTYRKPKSFRCNTYKKHRGVGLLWLTRPERPLIHTIHCNPAHQLGIKVGRLLRHHFAGSGDFHHLLDVAGIQQERNLRAPAVHGIQSRTRFPLICQV